MSDRQLYRDLNTLCQLKIAEGENVFEFTDEKNRKVWKLEYDESNSITQYDLNSFFLFRNFIPYTIHEHRKDSFEKLEQILYRALSGNKYQQYVEANEMFLNRSNFQENMYGAEEHNKIEDLIWAVQNRRIIVIEYDRINSANLHLKAEDFPVKMMPLELLFHRGRVYICGLSYPNSRYVAFGVNKTLRFQLTNEVFDHKKYWAPYIKYFEGIFGISDPVSDTIYDVKLEFAALLGESFKDYYWHPSQQWTQQPNGNFILHMKCTIGRELVHFVGQGLDKVKVLQPQELQDLVTAKLERALKLYQDDLPVDEISSSQGY